MALVGIRHFTSDTQLGLWNITESPDELLASYPLSVIRRRYRQVSFRQSSRMISCREGAACWRWRATTSAHTHDDNGRPLLSDGRNISISHTRGYTTPDPVGWECGGGYRIPFGLVVRIAHKFIREDEKADDVISQLIHWSVKESVHKYFGRPSEYFDMRLHLRICKEEGDRHGRQPQRRGRTVAVRCEVQKIMWLVLFMGSKVVDMTTGSPARHILSLQCRWYAAICYSRCILSSMPPSWVGLSVSGAFGGRSQYLHHIPHLGFLQRLLFRIRHPHRTVVRGARLCVAMRSYVYNSIRLSVIIAVVLTILMSLLCTPILQLVETPKDIFGDAYKFPAHHLLHHSVYHRIQFTIRLDALVG